MPGSRGVHSLFASPEEYMEYMQNPKRVVRVEWRKARREADRGWTSHSWLEATMQDGRRSRLELFADHGFTETSLGKSRRSSDPSSVIYEDRAAGTHELARPLTQESLRELARQTSRKRPYSISEFNCHHFVLDVWNSVVIQALQQSHYPDRVKTGLLRGLEESLGTWLNGLGFAPSLSSDARGTAQNALGRRPPPNFGHAVPARAAPANKAMSSCLSGTHEEGSRVSGNVEGCQRNAPNFDRENRLLRFTDVVRAGRVLLLEAGGSLVTTNQPAKMPRSSISDPGECECEAWADEWLAGVGYAAVRLAERVGATDVVDLVAKVFTPASEGAAIGGNLCGGGFQQGFVQKNFASFASLQGSVPEGFHLGGSIADICFVILRGEELRLAIFAILRPPSSAPFGSFAPGGGCGNDDGRAWRLRLLSGDAKAGEEARFTYTLRELAESSAGTDAIIPTAEEAAKEELDSMLTALATNDWGFVTLL